MSKELVEIRHELTGLTSKVLPEAVEGWEHQGWKRLNGESPALTTQDNGNSEAVPAPAAPVSPVETQQVEPVGVPTTEHQE